MKKVLSVFLAALMVFSVMSFGVSAAAGRDDRYFGENGASDDQVVFMYMLNGGKVKDPQYVYNEQTHKAVLTEADKVPQTFVVVPWTADMYKPNSKVTLPAVTPPSGSDFLGWERVGTYPVGSVVGPITEAPNGYTIAEADKGTVIMFSAVYGRGEVEVDTFSKVFDVLTNIFGAILGVLVFKSDIEAGKEFVAKLFKSISS